MTTATLPTVKPVAKKSLDKLRNIRRQDEAPQTIRRTLSKHNYLFLRITKGIENAREIETREGLLWIGEQKKPIPRSASRYKAHHHPKNQRAPRSGQPLARTRETGRATLQEHTVSRTGQTGKQLRTSYVSRPTCQLRENNRHKNT